MASRTKLMAALDEAVAVQFVQLFQVLYLAPKGEEDVSLERFARGVQKLLDKEGEAAEVVASIEEVSK